MSQKKVKVNLNSENPLKTILKNGYIPVVKRAKTGFKNIDVFEYFNDCLKKTNDIPIERGDYCLIGGIQEFFSDSWLEDNIYIGFVKKDTKVYSLFGDKGYMTAGEKFAENLSNYAIYYSDEDFVDLEDFDYETKCIIDAKDISNVLVIKPSEFYNLVQYSNDGALKLLTIGDIFRINFYNKKIPQDFFKFVNLDSLKFEDLEELLFSKHNCYLLKNLFDSYFKYISGRQDLINVNLRNYLDDIDEFVAWLDVYKDSFLKDYKSIDRFNFEYSQDSYYFSFIKDNNKWVSKFRKPDKEVSEYYISIYKNTSKFSRTVENVGLYRDYLMGKVSYNEYHKNKTYNNALNEKEIFCKDSLECLFVFLEVFEKYKKVFSKYYNIFTPIWVNRIKYLRKIYDSFNSMNVSFEFNDDISKLNIFINEEISLEYDFDLKDFVVTIKENEETYYYNIDNIPDEFEIERFIILDFLDVIDIEFELSV